MDRGMGLSARGATEAREAKRVAKECERGVLEVSLQATDLSNLQKARLLDILLWVVDIERYPWWELHRDSCLQVRHMEPPSAGTQSSEKLTGTW
jgi:hypothetical protein